MVQSLFKLAVTGALAFAVVNAQDPASSAVAPKPTAAPANPSAGPECVPAADSSMCSAFVGQSIDLRMAREEAGPRWQWDLQSVVNIGSLDRALTSMMMPETTANKTDDMYNYFGCPNWEGSGWRYRLTSICGYLVTQSSKCPGNANQGMVCPAVWNASLTSGVAQFRNVTQCPAAKTTTVTTLFEFVNSFIVAPADQPCYTADLELNNCGFGNTPQEKDLAATFCKSNQAEPCCRDLNLPLSQLRPKQQAGSSTSVTSTPTSTASASAEGASVSTDKASGVSVGLIAGIAAGGLVLALAVIITAFVCVRRRRQERELWQAHTKLVQKTNTPVFASPDPRASPTGSPRHYAPSPAEFAPAHPSPGYQQQQHHQHQGYNNDRYTPQGY
ncbi:hypothetical protein DFJ77DRAFT_228379 [Powellomyces hirtus]|nr:hypothetical protein DFJ77DRAFT_228379 [Powellomyces hirtus]